ASTWHASLGILRKGRRPQERGAWMKKSDPRARSDTERPVSWLPAPGLETTSTIKLGRRQRTAATADFPTRTASVQGYQRLGRSVARSVLIAGRLCLARFRSSRRE